MCLNRKLLKVELYFDQLVISWDYFKIMIYDTVNYITVEETYLCKVLHWQHERLLFALQTPLGYMVVILKA